MFDEFVSNLIASEPRIARNPPLFQQWIVVSAEMGTLEQPDGCFGGLRYPPTTEGGKRKTKNATKQVVIHPKLIEWEFMDYVNRQWKEQIFSEVAGTDMTRIGKISADLRVLLGIPYLDGFGHGSYCIPLGTRFALLRWLVG